VDVRGSDEEVVQFEDGGVFTIVVEKGEVVYNLESTALQLVGTPTSWRILPAPASPKLADQQGGLIVEAVLHHPKLNMHVIWSAEMRDGSNYVRQTVAVQGGGGFNSANVHPGNGGADRNRKGADGRKRSSRAVDLDDELERVRLSSSNSIRIAEISLLGGQLKQFASLPPNWSVRDETESNSGSRDLNGGVAAIGENLFVAAEHPLAKNSLGRGSERGRWAVRCTHSVYGARFSAEIYTRGCHWIPRMFA
jgi:hypothetical protein